MTLRLRIKSTNEQSESTASPGLVGNWLVEKDVYIFTGTNLAAMERHLPYGITQCYLPRDAGEYALPNSSHAGQYSIYLPWRDGRLS